MKRDLTDWLNGLERSEVEERHDAADVGLLLAPIDARTSAPSRHVAQGSRDEPSPILRAPTLDAPNAPTRPDAPISIDAPLSVDAPAQDEPGDRSRAPLRWPAPPPRRSTPIDVVDPTSPTDHEIEDEPAADDVRDAPIEGPRPDEMPSPARDDVDMPLSSFDRDLFEPSLAPGDELASDWASQGLGFDIDAEAIAEGLRLRRAADAMEDLPPEDAWPSEDAWPPDDPGEERDALFVQKLGRVIEMKKAKAAERNEHDAEGGGRRGPFVALLSLIVLVALAGTFFALRYVRRSSPDHMNGEAAALYEEGRWEESAELYRRAYERHPGSMPALMGLAKASERAGRLQDALDAWRLWLAHAPQPTPERAQGLCETAKVHAAMGSVDEAMSCLREAMEIDPSNVEVRAAQAELLDRQGRYLDALEARGAASRLLPPTEGDPDGATFDGLIGAGTDALRSMRYDDAMRHFADALVLRSRDVRPWLGLAGARQGKGELTEAEGILRDAMTACPVDPTIAMKLRELRSPE